MVPVRGQNSWLLSLQMTSCGIRRRCRVMPSETEMVTAINGGCGISVNYLPKALSKLQLRNTDSLTPQSSNRRTSPSGLSAGLDDASNHARTTPPVRKRDARSPLQTGEVRTVVAILRELSASVRVTITRVITSSDSLWAATPAPSCPQLISRACRGLGGRVFPLEQGEHRHANRRPRQPCIS